MRPDSNPNAMSLSPYPAASQSRTLARGAAWLILCLAGSCCWGAQIAMPAVTGIHDVQGLDVALGASGGIHVLVAGTVDGKKGGTQVAYVRSEDGGSSWTPAVLLAQDSDAPVLARRGNDPQIAEADGVLLAAWQSAGELPGQGPMRLARSTDGGHSWHAVPAPATGDVMNNQGYLALTADGAGAFHLAWLDDREESGETQGLRVASWNKGWHGWGDEITVDSRVCTCCWTQILSLPEETLAILYRNAEPRDVTLATRKPSAKTWHAGLSVGGFNWGFAGCPHHGGALAGARQPTGVTRIHSVVWTGKEGAQGLFYLQSDDLGLSWSSPLRVGDALSRDGDLAGDGRQEIVIAYTQPGARGAPVLAFRSHDGGTHWDTVQTLSAPTAMAQLPRVILTPWGPRVFWTETGLDGSRTWAMATLDPAAT